MTASKSFSIETPGDREIVVTRELAAPRELVFEVWTTPAYIVRWWGCDTATMPVCEVDLRVGGSYRQVMRMADGTEHATRGVYREIDRPARLVYTEVYEPYPDAEAIATVELEDLGGRATRVRASTVYPSPAVRAAVLANGVAEGIGVALERVAALLAELIEARLAGARAS